MSRLALFDLDHTLLSGDSDVLWCEFLMDEGVLDRDEFAPRNQDMARRYRDGAVTAEAFCNFYVATLAGRSESDWRPICERFVAGAVVPRIPASARELVESHRARGDRIVLTTATNRLLTVATAAFLRIDDLIATEVDVANGLCTGHTRGTLNMREGKVGRLAAWLADEGLPRASMSDATFYSDSINDLPLLQAVRVPVCVDPDATLRAHAVAARWPIMELLR